MPARHTRLVPACIALVLLAAGCGAATPAAGPPAALVAYSRCMRAHGLPTFPDPSTDQGIPKDELPVGDPRFASASQACQSTMPPGGLAPEPTAQQDRAQVSGTLAFARCLRRSGFPRFPDPSTSGQLTHQMVAAAGIDVRQPAVLRAADACTAVTHGLITPATVARFIAGQ